VKNKIGYVGDFVGFVPWMWSEGEKNNVDVLVKTSPFPFLSPSPEPEVLFQ